MPMPSSSTVTAGNCACCAPGLAGSSVTFAATSAARLILRPCSSGRSRAPIRSAPSSSASAAGSSIPSAPEVECIGKGKASAPYEVVTTNARAPGGQFVLHAKALPGNPYDGHTLGAVIEATERLTGREIERAYVDKGYRGHDTANPRRVFISGQKRGVFGVIKRELRRRSAIEAVIGHMKTDGHLGRCYLKGRAGDAANTVLTAVGYNLRLILAWLSTLLCLILTALTQAFTTRSVLKSAC